MSCKILPSNLPAPVEKIIWKRLDTAGDQSPAPTMGTAQPATRTADVDKLHGRIVELEQLMATEVRQARERGFQEGQKAGRDAATSEVQPVLDRLLKSCAEVTGMRGRLRRETEADVVRLTIAIARRVLRRELSVDPEAIHGIVKAALEKVQAKEICLIRLHPEHVAQARLFFEKSGLTAGFEITADPSLQAGGVIVETRRGNLDASVETQLKEIERGFTDRLGR
jgi:flagellar assembly protein FliH